MTNLNNLVCLAIFMCLLSFWQINLGLTSPQDNKNKTCLNHLLTRVISNMPYTEAVLREVMRRETLVALALPHRCTEDTYFHGYFIPKDTMMLANLWSSHMDETVWEDPFEFRPERHMDRSGNLKKKDVSMPFGLGKRLCSAETFARQNMFLLFSAMLQHFSLRLPDGHRLPDLEQHEPGINLSPKPFSVLLIPR